MRVVFTDMKVILKKILCHYYEPNLQGYIFSESKDTFTNVL